MENIRLLNHQIKPIEYIVARCKKQHGLILNHFMGTGKTLTALVFLKNYPNDKKVIILPKGFESIWKNEAKKLDILIDTITFITFNDLYSNFESYNKLLKDSICIVDEAHNLYTVFNNLLDDKKIQEMTEKYKTQDSDDTKPKSQQIKLNLKKKIILPRILNLINLLYSTKKILLLTGTLVTNNQVTDIRWLINIAAGKDTPPVSFDEIDFLNKFSSVSTIDKIWVQAFKPFLAFNPFNILPTDLVKKLPLDETNVVYVIYSILSGQFLSTLSKKLINFPVIMSKKGILDLDRYKEIFSQIITIGLNFESLRSLLFITILFKGFKLLFNYVKAYYTETYDFEKLNPDKLVKYKVDKYFSYFDFKSINSKDFPSLKEKIKKVNYTKQQLLILIKLIGIPENLENQEYVDLEIHSSITEAELFKDIYSLKSKYFIDKGRIIGNLYKNPEKFKEIVKIYKNDKQPQTVVYSNFYESGIILFSNYLKSLNIKHSIFDHSLSDDHKSSILTDFKLKNINMLLLHPDFYEGISIAGTKYLHVLEPVIGYQRREQLYARTVRFGSHKHLPFNERKVNVIQWGCTLLYDLNKILHLKEYVNQWLNMTDPFISIIDVFKKLKFESQMSPDDRILSHYGNSKNFYTNLSNVIQSVSIDRSKIPLNCCIWTPDDSCSNKNLISCIDNK